MATYLHQGLSLLVGLLQWFLGGDISVLPCMTCTMAAGVEDGRSTSVWGGGGGGHINMCTEVLCICCQGRVCSYNGPEEPDM